MRAELVAILANDPTVEATLCTALAPVPASATTEIEALHRLLSPHLNDYANLPEWGAAAYASVYERVVCGV